MPQPVRDVASSVQDRHDQHTLRIGDVDDAPRRFDDFPEDRFSDGGDLGDPSTPRDQRRKGRVTELLREVSADVRTVCLEAHRDAWIYGVDPALWQLCAWRKFVAGRPGGFRFNQRNMASWVRRSFPHDRALYKLFVAQYRSRAQTRQAGYAGKRSLRFWAFTDEENARIPNFYTPVNDFVERLAREGLVVKLDQPIGECEIPRR